VKHLEGKVHGLIEVLFWDFSGGNEENKESIRIGGDDSEIRRRHRSHSSLERYGYNAVLLNWPVI
jgi:hypothetical protein